MKILYLSVFRDASGWAYHAQQNMLALDAVGVEVVPRCVKLNSNQGEVHPRILEMEKRDDKDCEAVIQHLLPHLYEYHGGFRKNIGIYCTETSSFNGVCWSDRINLLDEAWVPCEQMKEAAKSSGVEVPLHTVGIPCDISNYTKEWEKIDLFPYNDTFKFYFIGDSTTRRKNLAALIKAFHLEFSPDEQVSLVIKSNIYGQDRGTVDNVLQNFCEGVKAGLKLYPSLSDYKKEILISEKLAFNDIHRLHKTCDCFVMPSYGESWCMPAFDAMGFGNEVIYNDVGGMAEMMGGYGHAVQNRVEPVYGMQEGTFPEIFLSDENWWNIDVRDLQGKMRGCFDVWKSTEHHRRNTKQTSSFELTRRQLGLERASLFDYAHVGKRMKELLDV